MCSIDNEERKDGQEWWNSVTKQNNNEWTEREWQLQVFRSNTGMKHHEMKEKVKTEYYGQVRQILEKKIEWWK